MCTGVCSSSARKRVQLKVERHLMRSNLCQLNQRHNTSQRFNRKTRLGSEHDTQNQLYLYHLFKNQVPHKIDKLMEIHRRIKLTKLALLRDYKTLKSLWYLLKFKFFGLRISLWRQTLSKVSF